MRAVVQRVKRAEVRVGGEITGAIGPGLSVLVGVGDDDSAEDAQSLAQKVVRLRIFTDADDKMNLSVADSGGAILAISQFTLHGDVRKGNRPSFMRAMEPVRARVLFDEFCAACRALGLQVQTGRFGADMLVDLDCNGPVTILLDTKRTF